MDKIGLHIRLETSIDKVAHKALQLQLPFFQTFTMRAKSQKYQEPTVEHKKEFIRLRPNFGSLYLHASYWINCAHFSTTIGMLLDREIALAQELGFDYFVIHPGAVGTQYSRQESIKQTAHRINTITKKYSQITILLENVAHARKAIGGNIEELAIIMQYINSPERVGFCIDTAHAYAFGYDISNPQEQDLFINLLHQKLTCEKIKLIHLTDTHKALGSCIDAHALPGAGYIGPQALQRFMRHPTLKSVPVILELPAVSEKDELHALHLVRNW